MLRLPARWGLALVLLLAVGIIGCGSGSAPEASPVDTAPAGSGAAETVSPAAPAQTQASPAAPAAQPAVAPPPATEPPAEPTAAAISEPRPQATAPPEPTPTTMPETALEGSGGGYVIGEGSEATFTVNEKLAWLDLPNDAVMRTRGLTGNIYLDGQASVIELDLHSMTSDSDRRDRYVQQRMFPDHRVATFIVADLGDLPEPLPEGEPITREVQGELSIRGVTKPIIFAIEARLDPGKLFVLGRTTFTWDELEIPPPNIPGRIQVKDEVRVEVLLSAVPEDS